MAWMAATWGSAGCVEGGGCLPESLGVTQMELCGESGWSCAWKAASGLWRRGGAFFFPLLPVGRPLPLLVGGGGGGASRRVTCLCGVDLGLSWVEEGDLRVVLLGAGGS